MGIAVVKDLPPVGANLHDHFNSYVALRCAKPITLNDLTRSPLGQADGGGPIRHRPGGVISPAPAFTPGPLCAAISAWIGPICR